MLAKRLESKAAAVYVHDGIKLIVTTPALVLGDELRFTYTAKAGKTGKITLEVARFNSALFDAGLALLADEPLTLTGGIGIALVLSAVVMLSVKQKEK